MKKRVKEPLILCLIFSLLLLWLSPVNHTWAAPSKNSETLTNQDQVDVTFQSGDQKISLLRHPIVLWDQLSSEDKGVFTLNGRNFAAEIARLNDFINTPEGLLARLHVTSKSGKVGIKKVIPLLNDDDLQNMKLSTAFNYQLLIYLDNWEKVSFSLPIRINNETTQPDGAPKLNFQPTFLINPTVKVSKDGYSLTQGIKAEYVAGKQGIMLISVEDWRITSNNGEIKYKTMLNIAKPGVYKIDYEITNPISKQITAFSRTITILENEQSKDENNFTPLPQAELIPIDKPGFVNYFPNYGIRVYDDYGDEAKATGDFINTGTQWQILYSAFDIHGTEWFCIGTNQWVKASYIEFDRSKLPPVDFNYNVKIAEKSGARLYLGYGKLAQFSGRVLDAGSKWRVLGEVNSAGTYWYNLGANQWVEGKYCQKVPKS